MPYAIRIHRAGGPQELRWEDAPMPQPEAGQVRVRHTAVGVNYIDVYHRNGLYPVPSYPFTPGMEAAGVIEAVGEGVEEFTVGERVAYCKGAPGSYAQYRVIDQQHLIKLPDDISDAHAAAMLLKGQTAHMLLRRTFAVGPGLTVLIHAAAGGVGVLMCQWARALGATVLGTVGSEEKAVFAKENGCQYPIIYTKENVRARVMEITGGTGCNVIYDSVGAATYEASINSLVPFGLLVCFGQSSGPVPPIDVLQLMEKGSLFVTRPSLAHYKRDYGEYLTGALELFGLMQSGTIKAHVGQSYYLSDAASAHADLEARRTHGSTIMFPDETT